MTDQPTIFISYSHKDEKPWKELIEGHLRVAERQGAFDIWSDRRMTGGDAWRKKIDRALDEADIAILLISHNFLTSNFIMDHEVNVLLERKHREGLRLYPILITDCTWQAVDWLENLNIRPLDGRALADFRGNARHKTAAGMAAEIGCLLKEDRESDEKIDSLRAEAQALSGKLGVTEEAVQSFLAILDERHVDSADLKDKLEEIAGHYREMQARLAALDQDDPVIGQWIEKAKAAIDEGEYDTADELLTEAEALELSAARQAQAQTDQRFLNAAATRALRGETSLTRLRYLDAAEHFAEAAKLVPEATPKICAVYSARQGDALTKGSRTLAAIEAYKQATALDADEFWPWIVLGRLHQQAGNLSTAEEALLQAKAAAEKETDERNLSVSLNDLGDVQVDQGWLDHALQSFQASFDIIKRLADDDPANAGWQRDLSVSLNKIGDVQVDQGRLDHALQSFQASFDIRKRLADDDPANAGWQRDLIISHWRLAGLAEARYVSDEALDHWRAALVIAKEMEESGRLAPTDSYFVETIEQRINALIAPAAGADG